MANTSNVPGVSGCTYAVFVDVKNGLVKIGDETVADTVKEARLFAMAYRLGREHKKTEIRKALSL